MAGKAAHTAKAKELGSFWREGNPVIRRIMRKHKGKTPDLLKHPEALVNGCMNYFNWVDNNQWREQVVDFYRGVHYKTSQTKVRAYTIEGLCAFVGVSLDRWRKALADEATDEDTRAVMDWATNVVYEQTFTGAAAGLLKDSVIMRKLGLAEKSEAKVDTNSVTQADINQGADEFVEMMMRMADRMSADAS